MLPKLIHTRLIFKFILLEVDIYTDSFLILQQQYICIHQCLMCVLDGNEDVMDPMRQEVHENQGYEGRF